jgi:hypothetical protein
MTRPTVLERRAFLPEAEPPPVLAVMPPVPEVKPRAPEMKPRVPEVKPPVQLTAFLPAARVLALAMKPLVPALPVPWLPVPQHVVPALPVPWLPVPQHVVLAVPESVVPAAEPRARKAGQSRHRSL